MTKEYHFTGFDQDGTPRVWGVGPTADVAETECAKAISEYVKRRPDTGPTSRWSMSLRPGPESLERSAYLGNGRYGYDGD